MSEVLVRVENIKKHFAGTRKFFSREREIVKAVDGLTFDIFQGETLSLVGESGCGKSTTGRVLLKLLEPTEGSIHFDDQEITHLNENELRPFRKEMQMVFQDPYASLNPRMKVKEIIEEPLIVHGIDAATRKKRVNELLETVGLNTYHGNRYPHEFSGGQRQRIGIARALAVNPRLIIADEPVSALDVSIQAQILNLLKDLQEEYELTYLFISHDLSVVEHVSDRVAVMYLGKIVELGSKTQIFENPLHPYTKALLSAVPIANPRLKRERIVLKGDIPNPANPPSGCAFHTRCPFATERCKVEEPKYESYGDQHFAACHFVEELA